ncbi:MAG: universal stress protein [Gammaproteobacteria bacterium]
MRILCGTDLLPKASSALDRAGMLALRLDAELTLLHVVPLTESERMLEQDMQRARGLLESQAKLPLWHHGVQPRVCVRSGGAARILIDTATELDASLVVLGTHRKRPVRDALAGTLAERLLGELECPVLIVHRMPWYAYRNVLLALDLSRASANAVRAAEDLVLPAGTRASVVHAYQPPHDGILASAGIAGEVIDEYSERWKQQAYTGLSELLGEVSEDSSRYDVVLENATTTAAVQNVAARLKPDLLVVGTRGRGRWRRALLGSVANRILSSVKSDVLVVPDRDTRGTWRNARADRLALDLVSGV